MLSLGSVRFQVLRLTNACLLGRETSAHCQSWQDVSSQSIRSIYDYRILAVGFNEAMCQVWHRLTGGDVLTALKLSVFLLRTLVLFTTFYVLIAFGVPRGSALCGILFVQYSINASFFNEGLNHYEPMFLLLFLWFLLLSLKGAWTWLPLVTVVASLVKETAVLLPILHMVIHWRNENVISIRQQVRINGEIVATSTVMVVLSLATYCLLRWGWADRGINTMVDQARWYGWGLEALRHNLTTPAVFTNYLTTYHLFLLLPFVLWNKQSPLHRRLVLWFCPLYILPHLLTARVEESRLFLPLLIVVLPGSIMSLLRLISHGRHERFGLGVQD